MCVLYMWVYVGALTDKQNYRIQNKHTAYRIDMNIDVEIHVDKDIDWSHGTLFATMEPPSMVHPGIVKKKKEKKKQMVSNMQTSKPDKQQEQ